MFAKKTKTSSNRTPVLVYGDWIVDENWVLATHESGVSSLKGKSHLRALGGVGCRVMTLCGAGQIARHLYRYHEGGRDRGDRRDHAGGGGGFEVHGLGTWGQDDDHWLYQLFDPCASDGVNPFTLHNTLDELDLEAAKQTRPGVHLTNLARACISRTKDEGDEVGTTRLYRLYRSLPEKPQGLELDYRIDFVRRCTYDHDSECRAYDPERLAELTEGLSSPMEFAVITDYGHGTVSTTVLEQLKEAGVVGPGTGWFVMSKHPRPTWLKRWKEEWGQIAFWLLHPQAVLQLSAEAAGTDISGREPLPPLQWFIAGRRPAREAIQMLHEMFEDHLADHDAILLAMSDGLSLLAVEQRRSERFGYYQPRSLIDSQQVALTGRTGIFFGRLLPDLLQWRRGTEETRGEKWLMNRLGEATQWTEESVEQNLERLANMGTLKGSSPRDDAEPDSHVLKLGGNGGPGTWVKRFGWESGIRRWKEAFSGTGLVRYGNSARLDVWRAACELDGFIEMVSDKRREISKLIRLLERFRSGRPVRPASAMIIAKPGSGKTFLVKQLAQSQDMPRLSFDVTQLITRENVIDCFDAIASAQAQDREARHLVFFDEINATIEGSPVYDLFLTVLEDGTYLRHGHRFKLDPCVFLFAGTSRLRDHGQAEAATKEPDFRSRLTLNEVQLDKEGSEEEIRLGFVYHGAVQLQRQHPEVRYVSAEVLNAFYQLDQDTVLRSIAHLVERFQNIQYGEVRRRNMPPEMTTNRTDAWRQRFIEQQGLSDSIDLDLQPISIWNRPPSR